MNNTPVDKMIDSQKRRNVLMKWLKKKCTYSDNVFKDPGYSEYYKRNFNLTVENGPSSFYKRDDIDHAMNIGYVDYSYKDEADKCEDDRELEQFIDYVPRIAPQELLESMNKNCTYDEREDNKRKMSRHNIVILPGSNHSNANFLFKELKAIISDDNFSYDIPIVNVDPSIPYKGVYKNAHLDVDKEDFYDFLRKNSKN